jgi:4-amino-4-deoxy-L-arabinose transferase-like glycosyltransferase
MFFAQGLSLPGIEYRDDEIFYFRSTVEMLETGNYLSPTYFGEDRFQKPILFYWMVLAAYKIFGINWFSARIISAVFAAATVSLAWILGTALFNRRVASLSVLILATVPLFYRHAKNAVPDMTLNFFITAALFAAYFFLKNPSRKLLSLLFFLCCAFGFMVKGYSAVIIPFLVLFVYVFWSGRWKILAQFQFERGIVAMLVIILPWFIYMVSSHGQEYVNQVMGYETSYRLTGRAATFSPQKVILGFFSHIFLYARNMFSYFAPWSVFFFLSIPRIITGIRRQESPDQLNALKFLCSWLLVVIIFFSMMYFTINHYLLALSTPFALLVSHFFLSEFPAGSFLLKTTEFFRHYGLLFIFSLGCFVFSAFLILVTKTSFIWPVCIGVSWLIAFVIIQKKKTLMAAPLALGFLIFLVYNQTPLIYHSGIVPQPIFQRVAAIIKKDPRDYTVGVGSHDIHEKELQIYIDKKIIKAGTDHEGETNWYLTQLYQNHGLVYCLITQKDFDHYLKNSAFGPFDVLQEEYLFRRKIYLNQDFWKYFIVMNRPKLKEYLLEKVILIKRESYAKRS